MNITLRQLEYVVTIEQEGQFSLAAKRLNVAQPSLSAQVASLEYFFGGKFFIRSRKGVTTTALGRDVIRRARQILKETEELKSIVSTGSQSRLSIGVLPSIGPYLLPPVVRKLHQTDPNLRLVVREGNTEQLDRLLHNNQVDLIISTPEDHPVFPKQKLFIEQLWAAFAADNINLVSKQKIKLEALTGMTFLTLEKGHRLSQIVEGLAQRAGGYVSDEYTGTSLDAVRMMSATGAGIAVLPDIYALSEAARGDDIKLAKIEHDEAQRQISLVYRNDIDYMDNIELICDLMKEEYQRLLALSPFQS